MKTPDALSQKLYKQWQQPALRTTRLLHADQWPVVLPIGKPTARKIIEESQSIKTYIQAWREVRVGKVYWTDVSYRDLAEPVHLPLKWEISSPSHWAKATKNPEVIAEFELLDEVLAEAESIFRDLLIRKRQLWRGKHIDEVKNCVALAGRLDPGSAKGKPLRLMAGLDVDTKFFERNENLLVSLLDERFEGEVKQQGLAVFLDAKPEDDHWLLIVPLQEGLLPFSRLRLSTKQLEQSELPAKTILIVENERCEHQLPKIDGVIAILGAGLDLGWLASPVFDAKHIIYWGDIDTWGFKMLATARGLRPSLQAVLMNRATFDQFEKNNAVVEPVHAGNTAYTGLTDTEKLLYRYLLSIKKGRLEQEYLPVGLIEMTLRKTILGDSPPP